ncbi:MAG: RNA-binding S1 domain-containing protein [Alphaproteobacteria bacterium]|nr:MAG: RNA-binding S1 domain-containing protein [Caulobacteraceae bacterium]TPW02148.1 MAG: RNA-binding S1 domain-containing protein [Alphaproteobacteria bacterium]
METWIDAAIGETRQVLVRDGAPIMLHVTRWSDAGKRALWGEAYAARVRTVDRRRRGCFVDLGLGDEHGFLRLDAQGRVKGRALAEGQGVVVRVTREAVRGKAAVLELLAEPAPEGAPRRLQRPECDSDLEAATPSEIEARERIDDIVDASLAHIAPIPGGGLLTIEPTAALVAIDVDSGRRSGSPDAEKFALDLNIAAAQAVARELRLRNLGGIVAIDFVSMRDRRGGEAVVAALKAAVADDPWGVTVAAMSRFGVVEMSRGQLRAPLAERFLDADGRPSAETVALKALRAMEREARGARGREVVARLAPDVIAWLEADVIGWREALRSRIGPRWRLLAEPAGVRERIDVEAV